MSLLQVAMCINMLKPWYVPRQMNLFMWSEFLLLLSARYWLYSVHIYKLVEWSFAQPSLGDVFLARPPQAIELCFQLGACREAGRKGGEARGCWELCSRCENPVWLTTESCSLQLCCRKLKEQIKDYDTLKFGKSGKHFFFKVEFFEVFNYSESHCQLL